jgi:hypothetical protein
VRLVAGIVDARDHFRDIKFLPGELADDDVVLVVAGDRDDDVRRPAEAGPLEDEDLGRVAVDRAVLELLLEALVARLLLLDEDELVAEREQRPGDADPDLPSSHDDDEHQLPPAESTLWLSSAIAVFVGETTSKPRPE